jgi:hypothetical protein
MINNICFKLNEIINQLWQRWQQWQWQFGFFSENEFIFNNKIVFSSICHCQFAINM